MITLSNISKAFGPKTLFCNVSLRLLKGEKLGLVGPNGAGKTTLFSIILGELDEDSGKVELERGKTIGFLRRKVLLQKMKQFSNLPQQFHQNFLKFKKTYASIRTRMIRLESMHLKNLQNTMVFRLKQKPKNSSGLAFSRMIFIKPQRP